MTLEKKHPITVLIPTYNVEDIIRDCIDSVKWADEIFVVDGNKYQSSTDNTTKIAKEMGARVLEHLYEYSAKQKNWAIPQAQNEWILLLDSDETVTPELKEEIIALLNSDEIENYDGFGIPRKHYFLGKFLRFGGRYPLYNIRLFRRSCRYEDRDVHAHIILSKERTRNLKGDILHFSDPTLEHFFDKFNRYTRYQANYIMKLSKKQRDKIEWKKFFTNYLYAKAVIKDYWFFLPGTSLFRFVYMYIVGLGFLDGKQGFLIAVLYAYQDYASITKYLELTGKKPRVRYFVQDTIKFLFGLNKLKCEISDRQSVPVTN